MNSFVLLASLLSAPNLSAGSTQEAYKLNAKYSDDRIVVIQRGMGVLPPLKPKISWFITGNYALTMPFEPRNNIKFSKKDGVVFVALLSFLHYYSPL